MSLVSVFDARWRKGYKDPIQRLFNVLESSEFVKRHDLEEILLRSFQNSALASSKDVETLLGLLETQIEKYREKYSLDSLPVLTQIITLANKILNYKPPGEIASFRFLVSGWMGFGKSSFINTAATALSDRVVFPQKVRSNPSKSITTELQEYQLASGVCLVDTWGWSGGNYLKGEFDAMINGRLRNFASMNEKFESSLLPPSNDPSSRVHCVIFAFPAKSVSNKEYTTALWKFKETAEDSDCDFIIAITQCDEFLPELVKSPDRLYSHPEIRKVILQLSQMVHIPVSLPTSF
jgi:hypothetical protein